MSIKSYWSHPNAFLWEGNAAALWKNFHIFRMDRLHCNFIGILGLKWKLPRMPSQSEVCSGITRTEKKAYGRNVHCMNILDVCCSKQKLTTASCWEVFIPKVLKRCPHWKHHNLIKNKHEKVIQCASVAIEPQLRQLQNLWQLHKTSANPKGKHQFFSLKKHQTFPSLPAATPFRSGGTAEEKGTSKILLQTSQDRIILTVVQHLQKSLHLGASKDCLMSMRELDIPIDHSNKTSVSGTVAVSVECSTLEHCQKETGPSGGSRETRDPVAFFSWHLFSGMMLYWILGMEALVQAAKACSMLLCPEPPPKRAGMNSTCQCQCSNSIELQDDRVLSFNPFPDPSK